MRLRLMALCLVGAVLAGGCWDRIELEDQLFLVGIGVDQGETERYKVTVRAAIAVAQHSGVLGGREGGAPPQTLMTVEADSIAQGIYVMNTSVSRRISMRHVRAIIVGEGLARTGLNDLWAELIRTPEIRATAAFVVARGSAEETIKQSQWPGEYNPSRIPEGILLVEKHLHMAPPIRLHHMINRAGGLGIHPFASVLAVNRLITTGESAEGEPASAVAGQQRRMAGNPVEVAGTALFRQAKLVGFLTVDETQALLAMRGEMGKAYVTIPSPFKAGETLMMRFQQENLPQYRASFTPEGPRVSVRLVFEGEVLSGPEDYRKESVRLRVEEAARKHMEKELRQVLDRMREWKTDPVGFGLLFRGRFARWRDWEAYNWTERLEKLQVTVEANMRIRRHGLILGGGKELKD